MFQVTMEMYMAPAIFVPPLIRHLVGAQVCVPLLPAPRGRSSCCQQTGAHVLMPMLLLAYASGKCAVPRLKQSPRARRHPPRCVASCAAC